MNNVYPVYECKTVDKTFYLCALAIEATDIEVLFLDGQSSLQKVYPISATFDILDLHQVGTTVSQISMSEYAHTLSHYFHKGVMRNNGVTPYTEHTDYVGNNAHRFFNVAGIKPEAIPKYYEIVKSVGYLHDTIENVEGLTDDKLNWRLYRFPTEVGNEIWDIVTFAVTLLTRKDKNVNILKYLKAIKKYPIAKAVKLADLEHNLSDLKPSNLRDKYLLCQEYLNAESA